MGQFLWSVLVELYLVGFMKALGSWDLVGVRSRPNWGCCAW